MWNEHTLHDVVAICAETKGDSESEDGKLPDGDRCLGGSGVAGVPGRVNDCPGADRVADVIRAVGEGCSASSDDE